jgi:ABC-type nickel/cobalt efflux system permease component RcnA
MVIAIGLFMLAGSVRRPHRARRHHDAHAHGSAHDHPHGHGHAHLHEPTPMPGWRRLAAIGVAGGLVPSTSALILLLGAISAGQPAYGLALALSFGLGMAAVLTGIGLALVRGRALVDRVGPSLPWVRPLAGLVPWVTGLAILGGGLLITGQGLVGRL